jgi:hypothetical protein
MLTFAAGAPESGFAASEMAKYYTRQGIDEELALSDRVAGYYGANIPGAAKRDPEMAELLGAATERPVTTRELANIIAGWRTDGDRIPGKQYQKGTENKGKITYYDFTLSAPKSVSIAWALAETQEEKGKILGAHRWAVEHSLAYLESRIGWARRGQAGRKGADKGRMFWWKFEDYTARPVAKIPSGNDTILKEAALGGDMQIHTHVVSPNVVAVFKNGEVEHVGSIDTKRLNGQVKKIGKVYQALLAQRLREHGVEAGLDKRTGMAGIHSVPRWAVDLFSKAEVNGNEAAKRYANSVGSDWGSLSPEAKAKLLDKAIDASRQKKLDDQKADFESWKQQADEAGYKHRSVLRPGQERFLAGWRHRIKAGYEASLPRLAESLDRLSVFDGQIAQIAAAEGLIDHGINPQDPERDILAITKAYRTEGVEQGGETTTLLWGKAKVEGRDELFHRFTTEKHLAREREAIGLLQDAAQDKSSALSEYTIKRSIEHVARETGIELSPAQERMALLLGTGGRASVGIGAAGVGKTTLLSPLVDAWHKDQRTTVGITVPWRQAHALEDAGIQKTYAAQAFIMGVRKGHITPDSRTVVVFDEMSQVGTGMMLDIAHLQRQHGFQLVGLGDSLQTNPIQAGNTIRLFEHVMGTNLPELLDVVRQGKHEGELTKKFRSGDEDVVASALEQKRDDGTLLIVPGDYKDAIKRAVDLWGERIRENKDDPRYRFGISVPTNADVLEVGAAIRARRQERGEVRGDARTLSAVDQHGAECSLPIAVGDRVRMFNRVYGTYAGAKRPGRVGDNGTVAEIISIQDEGLVLRTAKGRVATVPWSQFKKDDTGDRIRLTYGDAMTIDARQGDTVTEHVALYPNGSQAVNALKGYVAASRHRLRSWIITSQGAELQEIKDRRPLGDARNQITARAKVEQFVIANMARNLARQEVKQLGVDFERMAEGLKRGTIAAKGAVWDRPTKRLRKPRRAEERQAAPIIQAAVEAARSQQGAIAEAVEPWVARSNNLDYWVSQWAKGWTEFDDIVDLEYAKRLERVQAAGVEDIDYGLLRDRASDDVKAAIQRYEAAEIRQERDQGRER